MTLSSNRIVSALIGLAGGALVACSGGEVGPASLVDVVPTDDAAVCPSGAGSVISVGLDDDGNGVLDAGEVDSSYPVCDGAGGELVTTATTILPVGDANCPDGGTQVHFGFDADGSGVLEPEEVESSFYTCNGLLGLNEGTTDTPMAIGPEPFPPPVGVLNVATVGAGGTSYYNATTYDVGAQMAPYTVVLTGQESVLRVEAYSDADFAVPIDFNCQFWTDQGDQVCSSERLASASMVNLAVHEDYQVPNQFFMHMSFGAPEGTEAAPMDLGTVDGNPLNTSVSVHPLAPSYYSFTTQGAGLHTVSATSYTGDPNAPADPGFLEILIHDGAGGYVGDCDLMAGGNACLFGAPAAGTYYFDVASGSAGGLFELEVAAGGDSLPILTLNDYATQLATPVQESLPPGSGEVWYRVFTDATGELTILQEGTQFESYWTLYDTSVNTVFDCYQGMCGLGGLPPNTEHYLSVMPDPDQTTQLSAYNDDFSVYEVIPFNGTGSIFTTTGGYGYESTFEFNSGAFSNIDVVVDMSYFPIWSSFMVMEVYSVNLGFIEVCFFEPGFEVCPIAVPAGDDIQLVPVENNDIAVKFDLLLFGT